MNIRIEYQWQVTVENREIDTWFSKSAAITQAKQMKQRYNLDAKIKRQTVEIPQPISAFDK